MSLPAIIVVATVAVLTIIALAAAILMLLAQLKTLAATLRDLTDGLQPQLEQLRAASDVTRAELERVSDSVGALKDSRDQ